jgi:hypothetical protein
MARYRSLSTTEETTAEPDCQKYALPDIYRAYPECNHFALYQMSDSINNASARMIRQIHSHRGELQLKPMQSKCEEK